MPAPQGPLVVASGGFLTLRWTIGNETAINVLGLHITAVGTVDQSTTNAIRDVVQSAFTSANVANYVDTNTSLTQIGVRDLRQPNLAEFLSAVSNGVGVGVGERISHAHACCVTLRTAKAGKSFRGRVFLPYDAQTAADMETGQYSTLATASAAAFIDAIRGGLPAMAGSGGGFALAVVSRWSLPPVSTPVINCLVRRPHVTTQRRRLPRRG